MRISVLASLLSLVACGAGGYSAITPGMSSADATKEMSDWSSEKIVPFSDGYSATYYGNDSCILFKDDKVVAKDQGIEHRSVVALGNVGMGAVTICHALCLPPGMTGQKQCDSGAAAGRIR